MSRTHKPLGDFDVITGPPARSRPIPPASPPQPAAPAGLATPAPTAEAGGKAKPTS